MNAIQKARDYYFLNGGNYIADFKFQYQFANSVFIWTPELVLIAKPVDTRFDYKAWSKEIFLEPDAWYVHLLCGNLKLAIQMMQHVNPLPYVVFQRGMRSNKIHKLDWNNLIKHHG